MSYLVVAAVDTDGVARGQVPQPCGAIRAGCYQICRINREDTIPHPLAVACGAYSSVNYFRKCSVIQWGAHSSKRLHAKYDVSLPFHIGGFSLQQKQVKTQLRENLTRATAPWFQK